MYKLISKKEYMRTRDVELKNLDTGTVDYCFDDSDVVDEVYKDFYFMELNKDYDCKISLFGEPAEEMGKDVVKCKVIDTNILLCKKLFVRVSVGDDIYYVYQKVVNSLLEQDTFLFDIGRKDLIQVDDVIHGRCFRP